MVFIIPIPLFVIAIGLTAIYLILTHLLLFLFTVGPVVFVGTIFVRWCWHRQERRREARYAAIQSTLSQPEINQ